MFFLYRDTPITKTTILFTYCFSDRGSKIVTELALNLVFPPYDCSTLVFCYLYHKQYFSLFHVDSFLTCQVQ